MSQNMVTLKFVLNFPMLVAVVTKLGGWLVCKMILMTGLIPSKQPKLMFWKLSLEDKTLGELRLLAGTIRSLKTNELFEDPVPEGNPTKEYHTYGLDWEPGSLKFYYDGKLYKQINQAPDYPMGTILNIYTDAGSGKGNDIFLNHGQSTTSEFTRKAVAMICQRQRSKILPARSLSL